MINPGGHAAATGKDCKENNAIRRKVADFGKTSTFNIEDLVTMITFLNKIL